MRVQFRRQFPGAQADDARQEFGLIDLLNRRQVGAVQTGPDVAVPIRRQRHLFPPAAARHHRPAARFPFQPSLGNQLLQRGHHRAAVHAHRLGQRPLTGNLAACRPFTAADFPLQVGDDLFVQRHG